MKKILLLSLMFFIFTSCQTTQNNFSKNNTIQLKGVISATNSDKHWSGQFILNKINNNNYELLFFGPIGTSSLSIKKQNGIICLNDGKNIFQNKSDIQLMQQALGIPLPLEIIIEAIFNNKKININGYNIEYLSFIKFKNKLFHEKILVTNDKIKIKIVIKNIKY